MKGMVLPEGYSLQQPPRFEAGECKQQSVMGQNKTCKTVKLLPALPSKGCHHESSSMLKLERRLLPFEAPGETEERSGSEAPSGDSAVPSSIRTSSRAPPSDPSARPRPSSSAEKGRSRDSAKGGMGSPPKDCARRPWVEVKGSPCIWT
uniref:Uncharacterized protein n=1 Tax=Micrurus surinamensis TaxID=129470 RepID=A0A2D4NZH1_MICSU